MESDWLQELTHLEGLDLRRSLQTLASCDGAIVRMEDGTPLINFASNDYLDLARDPLLRDAAQRVPVLLHGGEHHLAVAPELLRGELGGRLDVDAALLAVEGHAVELHEAPQPDDGLVAHHDDPRPDPRRAADDDRHRVGQALQCSGMAPLASRKST